MKKQLSSIILLTLITFVGCQEDDYYVPSYREDLLSFIVGRDSVMSHLLLDDGKTYDISSHQYKMAYANRKGRALVKFKVNEDGVSATMYEFNQITCFAPYPADSFKIHPHDPINVTSVWKSGGFINLSLAPLVTTKNGFLFDFSLDSITHSGNDKTVIHTSLLFMRKEDSIEAYKSKLYHSIPLQSNYYPCEFDSMYIYINTYKGIAVYPFAKL